MRATTLKAGGAGVAGLVGYYAGLAEDQLRRDGLSRGPIDYYLDPDEPPGRWWGRGCPAVGLSGDVRPEQLEAMLHGRHPGHGYSLGRGFGAESARAFDATFSAPKSVSVLWGLSPEAWVRAEVLGAHNAAVAAALDWFERHAAVTRRGTNGIHQVDTRGLVAALFRQHTSREVDPQLHTHAVIWAKVQDPAGKWLALDARFLKRQQRGIGWIYPSALRSELSARLGVSWCPVSEGHADIDGVPAELLSLFSQRHAQVDTSLAELVAAWVDDHDGAEPDPRTLYRLERRAVLDSRPGKSEPVPADRLRGEWQARAEEAGLDALTLPDRSSPVRQAIPDDEAVIADTRAGIYVAMTRGRGRNVAWIVDRTGSADAEVCFAAAIARPPNAGTAHAVRDRLYRATGVVPPEPALPELTDYDPARRMAAHLSRLAARRPPSLSR